MKETLMKSTFAECPHGTFSFGCKFKCSSGYYGRLCQSKCECPASQCHHVTGCIEGKTAIFSLFCACDS